MSRDPAVAQDPKYDDSLSSRLKAAFRDRHLQAAGRSLTG